MSDKLKIIQEPLARQQMLDVGIKHLQGDRLFYKFETCSMHTYYIEATASKGSLLAAIHLLRFDFNVDANGYCKGCDTPAIQTITVVSARDVPVANECKLVFVTRLQ